MNSDETRPGAPGSSSIYPSIRACNKPNEAQTRGKTRAHSPFFYLAYHKLLLLVETCRMQHALHPETSQARGSGRGRGTCELITAKAKVQKDIMKIWEMYPDRGTAQPREENAWRVRTNLTFPNAFLQFDSLSARPRQVADQGT